VWEEKLVAESKTKEATSMGQQCDKGQKKWVSTRMWGLVGSDI